MLNIYGFAPDRSVDCCSSAEERLLLTMQPGAISIFYCSVPDYNDDRRTSLVFLCVAVNCFIAFSTLLLFNKTVKK